MFGEQECGNVEVGGDGDGTGDSLGEECFVGGALGLDFFEGFLGHGVDLPGL